MKNDEYNDPKLIEIFNEKPNTIIEFLDKESNYKNLCDEVMYILKTKTKELNIEIASITSRTKSINSFIEKISRKKYEEPFEDMTDLAGVRVVFLYIGDYEEIKNIIRKEFEIIEEIDKLDSYGEDRFGYGATHFIVSLGNSYSGVRYDGLKKLKCEIQIRTVLQDAWAIIDHHLVYKKEKEIPKILRRRINSLAAVIEAADNQFDNIKKERSMYIEQIQEKNTKADFLDQEINLDTLVAYLEKKSNSLIIKELKLKPYQSLDYVSTFMDDIDSEKYSYLRDIDNVLNNRIEELIEIDNSYKKINFVLTAVACALAIHDLDFRKSGLWTIEDTKEFEKLTNFNDKGN